MDTCTLASVLPSPAIEPLAEETLTQETLAVAVYSKSIHDPLLTSTQAGRVLYRLNPERVGPGQLYPNSQLKPLSPGQAPFRVGMVIRIGPRL